MESNNRPIEELWIEEYYGMDPERVDENTKVNTDYGDLVSLLTSFKEKYLEWILVKERLPDEDGSYLTVNKTPKYTQVGITQFDKESGFYSSWVTAWMPLPSPPRKPE